VYFLFATNCPLLQKAEISFNIFFAAPHKCFQEKKDILIMVDGSKSIGKKNFRKVRLFLQDFLSRVDVGPSRVHVSVIQFSDSQTTSIEVALNQYTTVKDLVAAVAKIMYQAGKEADLFNALRQADLMVRNCAEQTSKLLLNICIEKVVCTYRMPTISLFGDK
jgi:Mg-chelatase subunit ChlD